MDGVMKNGKAIKVSVLMDIGFGYRNIYSIHESFCCRSGLRGREMEADRG
jgi:hypothetical protein